MPIVAAGVGLVLVVAGAVVVGTLVFGGGGAAEDGGNLPATGGGIAASATATGHPVEGAPETVAPDLVSCWDGAAAARLPECTEPTGVRGLRWVFPSLDNSVACRRGSAPEQDRPAMRSCVDHLPDGTKIEFSYSQWASVARATDHYDRTSYQKGPWRGGLTRWLIVSPAGLYKAALMYPERPSSVTIYAPTESARDRAIAQLLEMRPAAELRGTS
jgi:hypothetical protein